MRGPPASFVSFLTRAFAPVKKTNAIYTTRIEMSSQNIGQRTILNGFRGNLVSSTLTIHVRQPLPINVCVGISGRLKRVRLHVLTRPLTQKVSPKFETNWGLGRSATRSRCLSSVVVFQTQMGD